LIVFYISELEKNNPGNQAKQRLIKKGQRAEKGANIKTVS
jgi:hypothetical protein